MDRRTFLAAPAVVAAATLSQKADAVEQAMSQQLDRVIALPWMCDVDTVAKRIRGEAPEAAEGRTRLRWQSGCSHVG